MFLVLLLTCASVLNFFEDKTWVIVMKIEINIFLAAGESNLGLSSLTTGLLLTSTVDCWHSGLLAFHGKNREKLFLKIMTQTSYFLFLDKVKHLVKDYNMFFI